jgi:hypothetical protein
VQNLSQIVTIYLLTVMIRSVPASLQERKETAAQDSGATGGGEYEEGEAGGRTLSRLIPDIPPAQGRQRPRQLAGQTAEK